MAELSLHNLKAKKRKKAKRFGRGNASGRGSYSGRGIKGQRARSGGRRGLKRRGLMGLLRNKPKLGGFKSLQPKMETVNVEKLEENFEAGEIVNAKKLMAKSLIKDNRRGVKILGEGQLTKKLTVVADDFSESAKGAIIKAGGNVKLVSQDRAGKSR